MVNHRVDSGVNLGTIGGVRIGEFDLNRLRVDGEIFNCGNADFANIARLLTAKHEQERAVNNLSHGRDVMGFAKSMTFTLFHCLRSIAKNKPVLLLFRC